MTMDERKEIFAKEYLSIDDICKLYDLVPSHASTFMGKIRKKLTIGMKQELRLDVRGRLHIQDYLDYIGVKSDRYSMEEHKEIFEKEYLSIEDICKLYDLVPSHASTFMGKIRKKLTIGMKQELRLDVRGRLHIQDYLDYIGVKSDRYSMGKEELKESVE